MTAEIFWLELFRGKRHFTFIYRLLPLISAKVPGGKKLFFCPKLTLEENRPCRILLKGKYMACNFTKSAKFLNHQSKPHAETNTEK